MIDQLTVREYEKEDTKVLPPLYKVLGYSIKKDELKSRLRDILANPAYGCLAAEKGSQILDFIGYVKLYFFEATGFYYRILALSVAKETRRQGIASRLIDELKKQAVKEGVKALALNSGLTAERNAAHQFYQAVGFEKVTAGFALHLKSQHE